MTEFAQRTEDSLLLWCNNRLRLSSPITAETNLLDEGYLDSLLVMAMVVYIEEQFGVTIDSAEISPRTFRSVRTLAALVARGASNRENHVMEWPLRRPPIPVAETATWSLYYLAACPTPSDPTIVWGTDVHVAGLEAYLKRLNADGDILILPSHVLVWAVGRCLREHPEFNRGVVHRRLYDFKQVNILMPVLGGKHGPEVCLLSEVDRKPLAEIAREIWQHGRELAKGTSVYQRDERIFRFLPGVLRNMLFRFMLWAINRLNQPAALWGHRACRAAAMVNYLGQRGAPPMRTFKPSRFPSDVATLNITMGPTESGGPDGPVAPLFIRGDHRVVDAYQLGQFLGDLRRYLMDPALLEQ